jgi:excisionase family DNA binding protein
MLKTGELPHIKVGPGKQRRIPRKDFEEYLKRGRE